MLGYYLLLLGVSLLLPCSPATVKFLLADLAEEPKALLSMVLSVAPPGGLSYWGGSDEVVYDLLPGAGQWKTPMLWQLGVNNYFASVKNGMFGFFPLTYLYNIRNRMYCNHHIMYLGYERSNHNLC